MGAQSRSRERDRDRGDRDRDRDRKKKKKRSASSESAERSREREKRRRKQQQEHVNKNRAPGAAPGAAPMPGAAPGGQRMFWDGFQWVPRAETNVNPNDPNVSRKLRRLYLGNLPYHLGVTEDSFSKQLYDTMKERGMCNDPNQNPVLHVWFAREKGANYGFCEVASIEETERALQLDGMLVLGVPVSIKRPQDASGPMGMINGVQAGMQMAQGGMLALPGMQVQATSLIIQIEQILTVDSKTTKEDYDDVLEDMHEGCGAHGKLTSVFIVRPEHVAKQPQVKAGDVFLKCASIDDATKVMRAMGHRKYDSKQIQMKSYEEDKFQSVVKPLM
eukprot:TRINITY_DN1037_c0_g1_i1.p1 TRINITY_DN1037_c0_g1~~TRINITY_DN1037_c0_g1_i1.p1  ORF type:complete len:332 (-),score=39.79 TRINITY_DN1037_c0_g1_i1:128-1123(-)